MFPAVDKELLAVFRAEKENPNHELGTPKRRTKHIRLKNLLTKCGFTVTEAKVSFHTAYATATSKKGNVYEFTVEDDRFGDASRPLYALLVTDGKRQGGWWFATVEQLRNTAEYQ